MNVPTWLDVCLVCQKPLRCHMTCLHVYSHRVDNVCDLAVVEVEQVPQGLVPGVYPEPEHLQVKADVCIWLFTIPPGRLLSIMTVNAMSC
jgi:hypothetical protein